MTLRSAPGSRDSTTRISATAQGAGDDILWLIDDRLVGNSQPGQATTLEFATPGLHRVVAVDNAGNHAALLVRVLASGGSRPATRD